MKTFIGILIGISLMFTFQKLMKEKDRTSETKSTTSVTANEAQSVPADFLVFYTQFHSDSMYQMSHIDFPLDGVPEYADSLTLAEGNFKWKRDDWKMHRNLELRKENFHENLFQPSDGLIFEFIPTGDKKLWIERRFLKSGGDWRLIYYSGLNLRN